MRRFGVTLAFLVLVAAPRAAFSDPAIAGPIDDSQRVTLLGNVRPEANAATDRGAVADALPLPHLLLLLRRPPQQEAAVAALAEAVHDPQSADYHRWLSAGEFGRLGADPADIDAIVGWLSRHGFRIGTVYPNRMVIDFSGTAGMVREAFHTAIHHLEVAGHRHIANIADPQLPAALAPAVAGIVSLSDFVPQPQFTYAEPCTDTSVIDTCYAVTPPDLARIYNLAPLLRAGISGAGETIVVIENSDLYSTADWRIFRRRFGLEPFGGSFALTHPAPANGGNNCSDPGIASSDGEATLDAEWATAAAPGASVVMAACADTPTTGGVMIALENVINAAPAPDIVSISYGECEPNLGATANKAFAEAYRQSVMAGISVFVAAGDNGPAACDPQGTVPTHGLAVNGMASTPYDVAVGGTDFADTYQTTNAAYWRGTNRRDGESALSYVPEIPWNTSCASQLLAQYLAGSPLTYGAAGFCNNAGSASAADHAGAGGRSACASGAPSTPGVVSGTCAGYHKPVWQEGVPGNPADRARDLPDVALYASAGRWGHRYITCFSDPNGGRPCTGPVGGWAGSGGTSYATPIMAGIQALIDQNAGGPQGNPNPVYYRLAAAEYQKTGSGGRCNSSLGNAIGKDCIFRNVTLGDNNQACTGTNDCFLPAGTYGVLSTADRSYRPAFLAGDGWNFATGLGSVNALQLVRNWPGGNPDAASPVP